MTSVIKSQPTVLSKTVTANTNAYGAISLGIVFSEYEIVSAWVATPSSKRILLSPIGSSSYYAIVLNDVAGYQAYANSSVTIEVRYRRYLT